MRGGVEQGLTRVAGGGELRFETDGSTDMAAWFPVAEVGALDRVQLVDVGLAAANLVR